MGERLTPLCPKILRGQEKLTSEQKAYARAFARERTTAMLSTAPIDEQKAEEHLRAAYRAVWLWPPAKINWFDSPFACVRSIVNFHFGLHILPDWVRNSVEGRMLNLNGVQAKVLKGVGDDMLASVLASMGMGVSDLDRYNRYTNWLPMKSSEVDIMGSTLRASVNASLRKAGVDETRFETLIDYRNLEGTKELQKLHRNCGYIKDDVVRAYDKVPIFAIYQFFHEVFKENRLIHLARFNEMVSGYRLGAREALVVHKPIFLKQDAQGRPHSAAGPCIQFRDEWGVYAWHGVCVPEKFILYPEQITRRDWAQELNAEVQRVIQERLGNERFIGMIGGKKIDADRCGKLIEIDLGSRDPERVAHYVQAQDSSTERQYYLRVPPSITSVDEAIAWTFGFTKADYQPGQET